MDITTFKKEAQRRGHYYDNRPIAFANWSKCWGLGFPPDFWAYQKYKLGAFSCQIGKIYSRHGSYRNDVYMIGGESVSRHRFAKALATFQAPELSAAERQYIDESNAAEAARLKAAKRRENERARRRLAKVQEGPTLFDVAEA